MTVTATPAPRRHTTLHPSARPAPSARTLPARTLLARMLLACAPSTPVAPAPTCQARASAAGNRSAVVATVRRIALLALLLGLGAVATAHARTGARATPPAVEDRWLETRLGGTPAGYLRETSGPAGAGGWHTVQDATLALNRMQSKVEIRARVSYDESADGLLRTVTAEVGSAVDTTAIRAEIIDGALRVDTAIGGRDYRTRQALAQPLLGPRGIRARSARGLRAPGDRIEFSTFAGEYAAVVAVVREVTGVDTVSLDGVRVPVVLVRETTDVMPVPMHLWLDADGRVLRMRQDSPFGVIEHVPAGADVRERVAAGATLPEETYRNAVAKANIRLPRPRSLETVRVRIDLKRPDSVMPALDGPDQTVIERGERHAVIEVRRGRVPASPAQRADATEASNATNPDMAPWLAPNAYLQSDHPEVLALARSLRRPGLDDYAQARVLQDWVATHMTFDAGIALVSASEAVRDRRGTCVAYAVVLTTLARALDIPARVVMGHVYAANMWGGHAWTEIHVDGRWLALDAAVWRDGPADPARIGAVRTSLEPGSAGGMATLAPLYGNEIVRVLGYTLDGVDVAVPDGAADHAVTGRDYRNDWLGVRFTAPAGYTFAEVDIMYPRSDIAVLRDAAGARIVVEQRAVRPGEAADPAAFLRARGFPHAGGADDARTAVAGRPARIARHDGTVAAVWVDDSDLWFVHAHGDGAEAALRGLLAGFTMRPPVPMR